MAPKFTYPDQLLHETFSEQAKATPDRVAIIDAPPGQPDRRVTYAELDAMTDALAWWLRKQGVVADSVVPIFMSRCLEYAVCYLAILKAGGAYVA